MTEPLDTKEAEFCAIIRRLPAEAVWQLLALGRAMLEVSGTGRKPTKQAIMRHAAAIGIEADPLTLEGFPDEVGA